MVPSTKIAQMVLLYQTKGIARALDTVTCYVQEQYHLFEGQGHGSHFKLYGQFFYGKINVWYNRDITGI